MNDAKQPAARAWWREPMVWLVVALPLGAVFASAVLIGEAVRSKATVDSVPDQVRRTAQIQETDFSPDERAARANLRAMLKLDAGGVELRAVGNGMDIASPLVVNFSHPLQQKDDVVVQLTPGSSGWRGTAALDRSHDWNISVQPLDARWRIRGRLRAGMSETPLQSSLAQ